MFCYVVVETNDVCIQRTHCYTIESTGRPGACPPTPPPNTLIHMWGRLDTNSDYLALPCSPHMTPLMLYKVIIGYKF